MLLELFRAIKTANRFFFSKKKFVVRDTWGVIDKLKQSNKRGFELWTDMWRILLFLKNLIKFLEVFW